jgi:hypothetical protein
MLEELQKLETSLNVGPMLATLQPIQIPLLHCE